MFKCTLAAAAMFGTLLLAGCGGADAPAPAGDSPLAASGVRPYTGPTPPQAVPRAGGPLAAPRPLALGSGGYTVDTTSREQVRLFHNTVLASTVGVASGWSGNLAACNAGDTSAEYKAATLRAINWFRAMAGIPASIQFDAEYNAKAQQAALVMAAQKQLDHFPPPTFACYTSTAAEAASQSNLALGSSGPASIRQYIEDAGSNNTIVGHRRWILYPQTQVMGTGDINANPSANALWVFDGRFGSTRPPVRDDFVAWPPPGYVPYTVVYPRWSFSFPNANFANATVTMTQNGTSFPVVVEPQAPGNYGENTIVWRPTAYPDHSSWARPSSDTAYTVTISNVSGVSQSSFTYTVTVFDPDVAGTGDGPIAIVGSGAAQTGKPQTYSFVAAPGSTSTQWRTLTSVPFNTVDGAEAGAGNFTAVTSEGYSVVAGDVRASGSNSFHLAHVQPVDQVLMLNQALAPGAGAQLTFSSRLGYAGTGQHAMVEVSTDDGVSWTAVHDQPGSTPESGFTQRVVSLAAYAERVIRLRFRYAYTGGLYYYQASSGIGWYIDNIAVTGVSAVTASAPSETAGNWFILTPATPGVLLLQARPGMNGYYAGWGLAKAITVTLFNPAECLFNWAEAALPDILAPHASTQVFGEWTFRHYTASDLYLGISSANDKVYYAVGGSLNDLGPKATWFATSGCQ